MRLFEDLAAPAEIDQAVRGRLAHSLAHVIERVGDQLDADRHDIDGTLAHIRDHRQEPGVFARYFDLVLSIKRQDGSAAGKLLAEIADKAERNPEFSIIRYEQDTLGDDFERFPRLLFAENPGENPMDVIDMPDFERARTGLLEAMEIVRRVDPELYEEIDKLFVLICVTAKNNAPNTNPFGGVTSLMVWGATFINIRAHETLEKLVGFLVHEITHGLLFGLSFREPLVLNPIQEGYYSPLRRDLRPMDGIYHATQVSARMAAFNHRWLATDLIDPGERDILAGTTASIEKNFSDGLAVIREHGQLSDQARALLDQSCRMLSVPN